MEIDFLPPLADARNYPSPSIMALPSHAALTPHNTRTFPANVRDCIRLDRARTGLYVLAKALESNRVFCPTYHCPAMIEPFIAAGKEVAFYPVLEDLTPDLAMLEQQLKSGDCVVGVRFFGFECGAPALASLCQKLNCLLIEDFAHAASVERLLGHAGVTSLVKFFPVNEGGELMLAANFPFSNAIQKSLFNLPGALSEKITRLVRKIGKKLRVYKPVRRYRYFDPQAMSKNLHAHTSELLDNYNYSKAAEKRRTHYKRLAEASSHTSLGKPLFPDIQDGVVPYVFPFVLSDAKYFDEIKMKGIQIYRWEEMVDSSCSISREYRYRLVQFPVHQDLTQRDIEEIASLFNQKTRR